MRLRIWILWVFWRWPAYPAREPHMYDEEIAGSGGRRPTGRTHGTDECSPRGGVSPLCGDVMTPADKTVLNTPLAIRITRAIRAQIVHKDPELFLFSATG
jgi:hypothetical protein